MKAEEGRDSDKVRAVSFYPRAEPVEPLKWKAQKNQLKPSSVKPPKLKLKELPEHLERRIQAKHPTQRRVNPNIKEVVKKEVIKLLDAGLIYPSSDSPWVSPVQGISRSPSPQKTKKKLSSLAHMTPSHINECHSDYAMLGQLFNTAATFQRCMTTIFDELIEDSMEVFMDDFSVFGSSFDHCLQNLEKMLKRCEETNLVLNWENATSCSVNIWSHPKLSSSQITLTLAYEFDIEIRDKKDAKIFTTDHLSRLENPDLGKLTNAEIRDLFLKEQLMTILDKSNEPWHADYANYLASRILPFCSTHKEKKKFFNDLRHYFWDEPFLFNQFVNQIIQRCVTGNEAAQILWQCHSGLSGGHHRIDTTARKVFKARFY
ncbi:hypothetical protein Tco_0459438 [Tanacetum coccineum]